MEQDNRILFKIAVNDVTNSYQITIPEGSNVMEVIFGVAVIAKVFERDGLMTKDEFMLNFERYLNDKQYEEVYKS